LFEELFEVLLLAIQFGDLFLEFLVLLHAVSYTSLQLSDLCVVEVLVIVFIPLQTVHFTSERNVVILSRSRCGVEYNRSLRSVIFNGFE
jgi:hypothetical protein